MATVNYFLDILEKTKTTADALAGDTEIQVESSSQFSIGDPIVINGERNEISDILDLTITLSDSLVADALSGSTFEYDDTDNDGLSVSTAKRTTMFISGTDNENRAVVWVKNTGTYFLHSDETFSYCDIVAWPYSADMENYENRPQDGIDSGWDDYVGGVTIEMSSLSVYSELGYVSFINIDRIDISSPSAISNFFSSTSVFFTNSKIYGTSLSTSKCVFFRTADNDSASFTLDNSLIDSSGTGAVFYVTSYSDEYNIDFNIINSTLNMSRFISFYTGTRWESYFNMNIKIDNSTAYFADRFSYGYNGYEFHGDAYLYITDSDITAVNEFLYSVGDDSYSGKFYFNDSVIVGSKISSGGTMFRKYDNYGSYNYNGGSILIDGCEIRANRIVEDGGGTGSLWMESIVIKNSELYLLTNIIQLSYTYVRSLYIENIDVKAATSSLIYIDDGVSGSGYISLKNKIIPETLINKISNTTVDIDGCEINGNLIDNGFIRGSIRNSSFGNINSGVSLDVVNCKVNINEEEGLLGGPGDIRIFNSDVSISLFIDYVINKEGFVKFFDSSISGEVYREAGMYSYAIYDCIKNGNAVKYESSSPNRIVKQVNIQKAGGSENCLIIKGIENGYYRYPLVIDFISADSVSGVSEFIVSVAFENGAPDNLDSTIYYYDYQNMMVELNMTIEETDPSEWSGLSISAKTYQLRFQIGDKLPPVVDSEIRLYLSILNGSYVVPELIIDPKIIQA